MVIVNFDVQYKGKNKMNLTHLRIFIIPSHICATYATLFARHTHTDAHRDVLLLDASRRRNSLANLILEVSWLHRWDLVHDFSLLNEASDYRPSPRKKLTRRIKTWPVIKPFYDLMLKRYMKKMNASYRVKLETLLKQFSDQASSIELFALTETYLNQPLKELFPGARMSYLEHGIGDYYYLLSKKKPGDTFYCIFHSQYQEYYRKISPDVSWIRPLPGIERFRDVAAQLIRIHKPELPPGFINETGKPLVLILLEAVDMYNVPDTFWTAYMDHIFEQLENPADYHFILKPHPMQSRESTRITAEHFNKLGYSSFVASSDSLTSFSIEILFSLWEKQMRHVFCLSSSGCFYLSALYSDPQIHYWYSTEFMSRYIHTAPPQYLKLYREIRPMIEKVFAERCKPY